MNQLISKMISYYSGDLKRIQHFIKVHSFAKIIGEMEGLEREEQKILEVAALVHDIGIKKAEEQFGSSNGKLQEQLGPDVAKRMLEELGYGKEIIERVCCLVGNHHTYSNIKGNDYQILVEADFLVNFYEDEIERSVIDYTYNKIFKTESGKQICKTMYALSNTD